MIQTTEIAKGIYRIGMWDEADLVKAKILWPGATYNLFLVKAKQPAIIQTMFRRSFTRLRDHLKKNLDPAKLRYIVVPHHEGDSSGAVNEWVRAAPKATILCSELCAALSLRDLSKKEPRVVADGEVVDLGTHRLRFLLTPQVNQWDSLMVYEETTGTLFPNDLFSSFGTEAVTDQDHSVAALGAARELGYQADDRQSLGRALDKLASLTIKIIAPMHGPTVTAHVDDMLRAFRDNALAPA
jgi:flavorubredoxin